MQETGTPLEYINGPLGGRERVVYDGKRMRKAISRKSIDPSGTFVYYAAHRKFMRSPLDYPSLNPHRLYCKLMLPTAAYLDNPSDAICTKFCRSSMNKQRYPIYCCSWAPGGRRLITGNANGEFTLWNGFAFNFETILQAHDVGVR